MSLFLEWRCSATPFLTCCLWSLMIDSSPAHMKATRKRDKSDNPRTPNHGFRKPLISQELLSTKLVDVQQGTSRRCKTQASSVLRFSFLDISHAHCCHRLVFLGAMQLAGQEAFP
eukprot:4188903-Amphidinium_carterae.1